MSLVPYLIVDGAAGLIEFLSAAFGAREKARFPRPGSDRIMHADVQLGDSTLELADSTDQVAPMPGAIHLYIPDVDSVYARAVRAGATSLMAPTDQFYGDREAALQDRWGNRWYIATHQLDPKTKPMRNGFRTVTPYLHPRGADRLLAFVKRAFGATEVEPPTHSPQGAVAHAALRIGDSIVEIGEAHDQWQPMPMTLHLVVDDCDEVYDRAIRAGATSVQALEDKPYGERNGGVRDPFDNLWYIATPK